MEASERQVRNRPPVEASGIGEYIHFECCPRYFKLRFEGDEERKSRAWGEAFRPLSPLLYGAGTKLEETTWEDFRSRALEYHALSTIKIDELGWHACMAKLQQKNSNPNHNQRRTNETDTISKR